MNTKKNCTPLSACIRVYIIDDSLLFIFGVCLLFISYVWQPFSIVMADVVVVENRIRALCHPQRSHMIHIFVLTLVPTTHTHTHTLRMSQRFFHAARKV